MRVERSAPLVLATLLACGSPGPPGAAPSSATPPSPAANTCSPARQVGGGWFHFADVMGGNSCSVYLEQDECVLGIYSDCTDRAVARQWLGRISADDDVSLVAQRIASPSGPSCTSVEVPGENDLSRLQLRCITNPTQASSQLVLERRIDPMPELGTPQRRVDVVPFTSQEFANYDHYMFDATEVVLPDRREIWFTYDDEVEVDSGLYILDQESQSVVADVFMPEARLVTTEGGSVVAASRVGVLKVDAATRTIGPAASFEGMFSATALAVIPSANRIFVGFNPGRDTQPAHVRSFTYDAVASAESNDELPINVVNAFAVVDAQDDGTVAFAFGFDPMSGRGVMLGLDGNLRLTREYSLPFHILSARYLRERQRIGAVAGNRYVELDPNDPTAPIRMVVGVPYTEAGQDFAFDPATNRAYFLGRSFNPDEPMQGYVFRTSLLTYIDLARETAVQEGLAIQAFTRRVLFLSSQNVVMVPLARIGTLEWVKM